MEHKLKTIVILGFLQLAALIVLQSMQPGSVRFMGYHAFKVGNRTVGVRPPEGSVVITDDDEIRKRTNADARYSFIIAGDTAHTARPLIVVDILEMGELTDFSKLLKVLEKDTTAEMLSKDVGGDVLTIRYLLPENNGRIRIYSMCRFVKCYPYYLRERADWIGTDAVPESVPQAMAAIEVKK